MISSLGYGFPSYFNSHVSKIKKKSPPFIPFSNRNELQKWLTVNNCCLDFSLEQKNEIKNAISAQSHDVDTLDEMMSELTEWGMKQNPEKCMSIFAEVIELDLLTKVIKKKKMDGGAVFTTLSDLVLQNTLDCPVPVDSSIRGRIHAEWKIFRPLIIYFIPNLLNLFLGAFNFLDSNKKFTTLWEKHLLLEIVYKFFLIPYCLIKILQPIFVVTTKVYLVASLIIAASAVLISCYQRWLRPLPDEIVNCTNLDKQMDRGCLDPKVGQVSEIDQLIAGLEGHDNLILVGLSGEGKTALIHHFIQLKHSGKIHQNKLEERIVFEADCGIMISSASFGHAELINQTKDQIRGYEDKVLLFFDDFYQIATNKAAFLTFKKRFLQDTPACKSILAVTLKEWIEIQKLDIDHSFQRKVHIIKIGPSSDEQVKKVLKNLQLHSVSDVFVEEEAIEAIVKLSGTKDYLPNIGRPAKAEEILRTARGKCVATLGHYYGTVNLSEKEKQKTGKIVNRVKTILAYRKKLSLKFYALNHLFNKAIVGNRSINHIHHDPTVSAIKSVGILDSDSDDDKKNEKIEKAFGSPHFPKGVISEKDQIMYLWYSFYAKKCIEKLLKEEISKIDSKINIHINKKLVEKVYQERKDLDLSLEN